MLGYAVSAFLAVYTIVQFVVVPLYQYFRDPKGLRRFPTLDRFAGFTNLSFMVESHRGFRSKKLASLHKTHPVIRTGPNSLSFGEARAIKVRSFLPHFGRKTNEQRTSMAIIHPA